MSQPAREPLPCPRILALQEAIRRTLAYFDLFSFSLTSEELHRYLHNEWAEPAELDSLLRQGVPGVVSHDGLFVLAGSLRHVIARRQVRQGERLRGRARRYAVVLKHLPYVRMIGLTGSLSLGDPAGAADIDLMVVSVPGRVWLCRALVIALVRLARVSGDTLCPNYVVAANRLALDDISIYDAHELAQMLPLYGQALYHELWASNPGIAEHLPNARPLPLPADRLLPGVGLGKRTVERLLSGRIGDRLERWERTRKIARFQRQAPANPEITLTPDQCKGHFDGHRARVLACYQRQLERLQGG